MGYVQAQIVHFAAVELYGARRVPANEEGDACCDVLHGMRGRRIQHAIHIYAHGRARAGVHDMVPGVVAQAAGARYCL